jgi:hypothetical protein
LALRHQGLEMDEDEVECLVAGLIWKVSQGSSVSGSIVVADQPDRTRRAT